MVFIRKDRREKKKAAIVTYDWLEDSLEDNKAIQDVSAYNPGKPRDIPAILAARHKGPKVEKNPRTPKTSKDSSMNGNDGPDATMESEPVAEMPLTKGSEAKEKARPASPDSSISESDAGQPQKSVSNGKKAPSSDIKKPSLSRPSPNEAILSKPLPRIGRSSVPAKQATSVPNSQVAIPKALTPQNTNLSAVERFTSQAKPILYLDKVDKFPYSIKLTHKNNSSDHWQVTIYESTSGTKSFLFRVDMYYGGTKSKLNATNSPVPSSEQALKLFSEAFRMRMSYNWEERLIRAGGEQLGDWRYELPADGKTGKTPPEYTPGNPKCKKLEDLEPIYRDVEGQRVFRGSDAKRLPPSIPRNSEQRKTTVVDRAAEKVSKPSNPASARQTRLEGPMGSEMSQSKARTSGAAEKFLKRKAAESPAGRGQYSKVTKADKSGGGSSNGISSSRAAVKPLKRKAAEPPAGPGRYSKVNKRTKGTKVNQTGSSKIKSAIYAFDSEDSEDPENSDNGLPKNSSTQVEALE